MINIFLIPVTAFSLAAGAAPAGVLENAGRRVTAFWDKFSSVTCTETIEQKKLDPGGRTLLQRKATFDYLILLQRNGEDLLVEESRVLQGKPGKESDKPMLTTSGFSALLLILHPMFQPSFEFSIGEEELVGGRRTLRVRFSHRKGERSPSVLQLHGREYPIPWEGEALIDGETYSVRRMRVQLKAPMDDIGLMKMSSEVEYAPHRAGDKDWLPAGALIEAETRKQRWRNTHQFSHYREFAVDTDVKLGAPKQ